VRHDGHGPLPRHDQRAVGHGDVHDVISGSSGREIQRTGVSARDGAVDSPGVRQHVPVGIPRNGRERLGRASVDRQGADSRRARGGALTVTWCVASDERLWWSTTVRIAVYTPGLAYACVGMTPLPTVESPNSHAYETIVPSGSNDAVASNVTGEPGFTGDGLAA